MEQQLDHYKIEGLIGAGAFAQVYRAFDTKLQRHVALKVLKPLWLDDPQAMGRFKQESITMAGLHHPHIVTIYEVGEARGLVYLAELLVEGETLAARLKQGPLNWEQMLEVLRSIASALDYAHEQGVIHRDIKPANILLGQNGQAYLSDFGLVRAAEGSASLSASSGGLIGTPYYMAPEQWRDQPVAGTADVYALTSVVIEMLTGQVFFTANTPAAIMTKHLMERPALPATWPTVVPSGLNKVLQQGLAVDPARRFQTASELVAALSKLKLTQKSDKNNEETFLAVWISRLSGWIRKKIVWGLLAAVLLIMVGTYAVFYFGNSNNQWVIVMSQEAGVGSQIWYTDSAIPEEFIRENWVEDYRITSLSYGDGQWAVMMSQESGFGQQVWHTETDTPVDFVTEKWQENYKITNLTYDDGRWIVVMSLDTGLGKQIWQTQNYVPTDFITENSKAGYRITNLTYGNGDWTVVMSQDTGISAQLWYASSDIPDEFIKQKWVDDYRITNLTRGDGQWGVVMSQGIDFGSQLWHMEPGAPTKYISQMWIENYRVTSLDR